MIKKLNKLAIFVYVYLYSLAISAQLETLNLNKGQKGASTASGILDNIKYIISDIIDVVVGLAFLACAFLIIYNILSKFSEVKDGKTTWGDVIKEVIGSSGVMLLVMAICGVIFVIKNNYFTVGV